jgi:transposase
MGTYSPTVIEAVPASKTVSPTKRQRHSLEEKRGIVEETLIAGASVARVARARGINANQVFTWRRLYQQGRLGTPTTSATRLLPVSVAEVSPQGGILTADANRPLLAAADGNGRTAAGTIHLELRKARVRIEGNVDPAVLRLVLQSVLG